MNREDIGHIRFIRMAREAGFERLFGKDWVAFTESLEAFAALVAEHEREKCAKLCDDWPNGRDDVYSIGVAIRARGNI